MTDDLPPALKRDANNVAPFMKIESIGTEGGPFFDMWKNSSSDPTPFMGIDPAKPGSDRTVLHCSCGLMSGECKRAGCPYVVKITPCTDGGKSGIDFGLMSLSPEANPPTSFPWERPPSESTS